MAAVRTMTIGQLVDFCIEYNNRHATDETQEEKPQKRWATRDEINAFFGG